MKVSLLIVVLFLIINKTNGQAYMANHAGRSAYIYEHSLLKISPEYPAENRTHIYADKSVAIENIGSKSLKKEEVLGDTFKVLNVINIDYTTKLLELERLSNSSILYYRYTIFHGVDFPFNIVKMDIQKDLVMKEIEYSKDDFTKSETYRTPISGNNKFHLIKIKDKGQIHFYLTLQTTGITPNVNQKGVYLLFEDGRVWDKPDVDVDIEVSADGDRYEYSAFVPLTQTEMILLSRLKLKKYRLFVYDETLTKIDSDLLSVFSECMIDGDDTVAK